MQKLWAPGMVGHERFETTIASYANVISFHQRRQSFRCQYPYFPFLF